MKRIKRLSLIAAALAAAFLAGCTDGELGKLSAYGGSAHVTCYSAELKIFDGQSTGKVTSEANSDGYYFIDKEDGKLKEVSGNCVIEYEKY